MAARDTVSHGASGRLGSATYEVMLVPSLEIAPQRPAARETKLSEVTHAPLLEVV
ncbi:MAG: hypothetical protein QOD64_2006 [Verrucomicrobiota bacterium]